MTKVVIPTIFEQQNNPDLDMIGDVDGSIVDYFVCSY